MSVGTISLSDFLLARIAEDEAVAVGSHADEGWYTDAGEVWVLHDTAGNSASGLTGPFPIWSGRADEHIARWDPARVLAECEAKRLIVALHDESEFCERIALSDVLTFLAEPYADHEDYDPQWRP